MSNSDFSTRQLIINGAPQKGYVVTCADNSGRCVWGPGTPGPPGASGNVLEWSTLLVCMPDDPIFNPTGSTTPPVYTDLMTALTDGAAIYAASGGVRRALVLVRPGTYAIDTPTLVPEGVDIRSAIAPNAAPMVSDSIPQRAVYLEGGLDLQYSCSLCGLQVQMPDASAPALNIQNITDGGVVSIDDCTFVQTHNNFVLSVDQCPRASFSNCAFSGSKVQLVSSTNLEFAHCLLLVGSTLNATSSGTAAMQVVFNNTYVQSSNTTVSASNTSQARVFFTNGSTYDGPLFSASAANTGVAEAQFKDSTVMGTTFQSAGTATPATLLFQGCQLSSPIFNNLKSWAVVIDTSTVTDLADIYTSAAFEVRNSALQMSSTDDVDCSYVFFGGSLTVADSVWRASCTTTDGVVFDTNDTPITWRNSTFTGVYSTGSTFLQVTPSGGVILFTVAISDCTVDTTGTATVAHRVLAVNDATSYVACGITVELNNSTFGYGSVALKSQFPIYVRNCQFLGEPGVHTFRIFSNWDASTSRTNWSEIDHCYVEMDWVQSNGAFPTIAAGNRMRFVITHTTFHSIINVYEQAGLFLTMSHCKIMGLNDLGSPLAQDSLLGSDAGGIVTCNFHDTVFDGSLEVISTPHQVANNAASQLFMYNCSIGTLYAYDGHSTTGLLVQSDTSILFMSECTVFGETRMSSTSAQEQLFELLDCSLLNIQEVDGLTGIGPAIVLDGLSRTFRVFKILNCNVNCRGQPWIAKTFAANLQALFSVGNTLDADPSPLPNAVIAVGTLWGLTEIVPVTEYTATAIAVTAGFKTASVVGVTLPTAKVSLASQGGNGVVTLTGVIELNTITRDANSLVFTISFPLAAPYTMKNIGSCSGQCTLRCLDIAAGYIGSVYNGVITATSTAGVFQFGISHENQWPPPASANGIISFSLTYITD